MNDFVWVLVGLLATFKVVHDLLNPSLTGPFRVYDSVRWFFALPIWPEWVADGAECPECLPFGIGFVVGLLVNATIPQAVVLGLAYGGAISFWLRWLAMKYDIGAGDFLIIEAPSQPPPSGGGVDGGDEAPSQPPPDGGGVDDGDEP